MHSCKPNSATNHTCFLSCTNIKSSCATLLLASNSRPATSTTSLADARLQRTIAEDKRTVNWTSVAREYENRYLTKNTMHPVCDSCQVTGHIEKWCPIKKNNRNRNNSRDRSPLREYESNDSANDFNPRNEFRNDSRASTSRFTRSRASNQNTPCHRYNSEAYCHRPSCNNPHICNVCGGNHPGGRCNDTTSSRFRGSRGR